MSSSRETPSRHPVTAPATKAPGSETGVVQPQRQQQQSSRRGHGRYRQQQTRGITEDEADLYLDQYNFTTTAAIVSSADRKIFVLLRDGRLLFGVLRTFDQYANLILQHCKERIYLQGEHKNQYAEENRGVFMIRGENVVMLGEVDIDKEDAPLEAMEKIPFSVAQAYKKEADEARYRREHRRTKLFAKHGLIHDFHKYDMY